jgi:hypothetical protein
MTSIDNEAYVQRAVRNQQITDAKDGTIGVSEAGMIFARTGHFLPLEIAMRKSVKEVTQAISIKASEDAKALH